MPDKLRFTLDYEEFMKPSVWGGKGYIGHHKSWFGDQTFEQIRERALHGDDSLVPEAEKLIAKLDADIELEHREWLPSVYGAYPVVAEYLAGSHTPMRHQTRVPAENEPVSIWIDSNVSAGITYETIKKRGIVVLALLMKLQQVRAVDLHYVCALPTPNVYLDLIMPTRPLPLGVVCHVLTSVGFTRHVMFAGCEHLSKRSWSSAIIRDDKEFRQKMNIPDNDVTIVGSHLQDVRELNNSFAWVQGIVNKYVHREE